MSGPFPFNVSRDPEGAELEHLAAACQLASKQVLEIGCGNGYLTWQYAGLPNRSGLPRRVIGIDPNASALHEAISTRPASTQNGSFTQASGAALPFPSQVFDIVIFALSL